MQHKKASSLFALMNALVVIGNPLLILANLIKVGLLDAGMRNGGVGAEAYSNISLVLNINMLSCVGSMLGAALMLKGKMLGYKIYALSFSIHALLVLFAILLWASTIYLIGISVLLVLYFIVPVLFFLFFRMNRKHLS